MSHDKGGGRKALLRAVSVLGISLGMSSVALADEAPKEIGSATGGAGAGKVMTTQQKADYLKLQANQHKADYLKLDANQLKYESGQIKGESNQLKYESGQHKGQSNQLKLDSLQHKIDSNQHKQGVSHELNPQPEPPG